MKDLLYLTSVGVRLIAPRPLSLRNSCYEFTLELIVSVPLRERCNNPNGHLYQNRLANDTCWH